MRECPAGLFRTKSVHTYVTDSTHAVETLGSIFFQLFHRYLISGSMKLFDMHDALVNPSIAIMSPPYTAPDPRPVNGPSRYE
jgi:hypothetical protein